MTAALCTLLQPQAEAKDYLLLEGGGVAGAGGVLVLELESGVVADDDELVLGTALGVVVELEPVVLMPPGLVVVLLAGADVDVSEDGRDVPVSELLRVACRLHAAVPKLSAAVIKAVPAMSLSLFVFIFLPQGLIVMLPVRRKRSGGRRSIDAEKAPACRADPWDSLPIFSPNSADAKAAAR